MASAQPRRFVFCEISLDSLWHTCIRAFSSHGVHAAGLFDPWSFVHPRRCIPAWHARSRGSVIQCVDRKPLFLVFVTFMLCPSPSPSPSLQAHEDPESIDPVPYVLALQAFSEVDPSLCMLPLDPARFITTLLPYVTAHVRRECGKCFIMRSVMSVHSSHDVALLLNVVVHAMLLAVDGAAIKGESSGWVWESVTVITTVERVFISMNSVVSSPHLSAGT